MSKPTPPHHKTVRIPFAKVANGYGGVRTFPMLEGEWFIVGATTHGNFAPYPCPSEMLHVIVAPARGPK